MNERGQFSRMILMAVALVVVFSGLAARLFYLHLGENGHLRDHVKNVRERTQEILVGRGRILDRAGNIMALDREMKHVVADPKAIIESGHSGFIMHQLARMLEMDPAIIQTRIIDRPERRYERLRQYVPVEFADTLHSMGMTGIFFDDASARSYPRGTLGSHVIGFSNLEGFGGAGVELRYDRRLRGVPGIRQIEIDGRRREVYTRRGLDIRPQEGADVHRYLDQHVQYFVERALDKAMVEHNALGAWAVVQHVRSGEILAMASRPTYDPNLFRTATDNEKLNRAIGFVYEPGSTFKVAVFAAAFNEGLIRPDELVDCENGVWIHNGRPLRDYRPHGILTYADALKKSSNIAAAKVALMLGEERLYRYLKAFGIGEATGIELPGEEAGIFYDPSKWSGLSVSRIAMGHEVAVTSLQMVNVLSALGNKGFLMKPRIVQQVVNPEGEVMFNGQEEVLARPVRGDTAALMVRLMARITEAGGSGVRAAVDGYTVAGKTGTAQKPIPGGYSDTANFASFMGLIPAEDPELSILVVVDEPQPERTGGRVAGPVYSEIAGQAMRYLDIPPVRPEVAEQFMAMYVERP
ncbi:MAG: peptidoglycan D,D-transpeptidase FtsI family protein [Kiritimatiellia bacterium]